MRKPHRLPDDVLAVLVVDDGSDRTARRIAKWIKDGKRYYKLKLAGHTRVLPPGVTVVVLAVEDDDERT